MTPSTFITTADVAETFGVDPSTVARWVQLGRLEAAGQFGRGPTAPRMFDAATVAAFGAALRILATAGRAA